MFKAVILSCKHKETLWLAVKVGEKLVHYNKQQLPTPDDVDAQKSPLCVYLCAHLCAINRSLHRVLSLLAH